MHPDALDLARSVKGFMPDDEGLALHEAGVAASTIGPLLEIGSYCGKSAVYLGTAAQLAGTVLFTVDHHHGSEENQAGWDHHDPEVVDPRTGRMETLPFLRRTIEAAGARGHRHRRRRGLPHRRAALGHAGGTAVHRRRPCARRRHGGLRGMGPVRPAGGTARDP